MYVSLLSTQVASLRHGLDAHSSMSVSHNTPSGNTIGQSYTSEPRGWENRPGHHGNTPLNVNVNKCVTSPPEMLTFTIFTLTPSTTRKHFKTTLNHPS